MSKKIHVFKIQIEDSDLQELHDDTATALRMVANNIELFLQEECRLQAELIDPEPLEPEELEDDEDEEEESEDIDLPEPKE